MTYEKLTQLDNDVSVSAHEKKYLLVNGSDSHHIIHLQDNSFLSLVLLVQDLQAGEAYESFDIHLEGEGAELEMFFVSSTHAKENYKTKIEITHKAANTKSRFYGRSVLRDASILGSDLLVHIEKNARGSDSFVSHHALMLSPDTRARIIPSLKIDENDVKAGHSATVEQYNIDEAFYAQSRGIELTDFIEMISESFVTRDLITSGKNDVIGEI